LPASVSVGAAESFSDVVDESAVDWEPASGVVVVVVVLASGVVVGVDVDVGFGVGAEAPGWQQTDPSPQANGSTFPHDDSAVQ
jgi:hypothetical protein